MGLTEDLLRRYAEPWKRIVEHPFLYAIGSGRVSEADFARWLEQDYHFIRGLIHYVRGLAARLDAELAGAISQAIPVLEGELQLFAQAGPDLAARIPECEPAPACFHYLNYLAATLEHSSPAVCLLVYWALEQAYFDGWSFVAQQGRADPRLHGFIQNWTCQPFGEYVAYLRQAADRLLAEAQIPSGSIGAPAGMVWEGQSADAAFLSTIRCEHSFWDIGLNSNAWPV